MKNKNGFLLAEETLKIVIAVICIGFLVYFLTALYFAKINNEKLKQAEAILKGDSEGSIKTAIDNLENINPAKRQLVNPEAWYLFGFTGEKKPDSCAEKNCLCICDNVYAFSYRSLWTSEEERQTEKCSEKGVCLIVSDLQKEKLEIEIKQQFILIKKVNDKIEIKEE